MFDTLFSHLDTTWGLTILLIVGFVLLIKGADFLIDGAAGLAKRLNISDLVIGLTVVAFGTSMPEFVVNMVSVAKGVTDIAITNIIGSNIINIFVILGCSSLVYPLVSKKASRKFDIPFMIGSAIMVVAFTVFDGTISRGNGIALLVVFIIFLWFTFRLRKKEASDSTYVSIPIWKAVLLILGGLICLTLGGQSIVHSATSIASKIGIPDSIIGLTIVALGTSLPELATSVMAAYKHNSDLAIGNVVGSNIFNVFLVLGASAAIRPLPAYEGLALDSLMALVGAILVWVFVMTNKEKSIKRWEGLILLCLYTIYLVYRIYQTTIVA